jgi:Integrase zinc binding domain
MFPELHMLMKMCRGIGPFSYEPTCIPENKKVSECMANFRVSQDDLLNVLTDANLYQKQCEDEQVQKIIEFIKSGKNSNYFVETDILKFKNKDDTVLYQLTPYVLAFYHLSTHAGSKKLASAISKKYHWKTLVSDAHKFSKGCALCSIMKHSNQGRGGYGVTLGLLCIQDTP